MLGSRRRERGVPTAAKTYEAGAFYSETHKPPDHNPLVGARHWEGYERL